MRFVVRWTGGHSILADRTYRFFGRADEQKQRDRAPRRCDGIRRFMLALMVSIPLTQFLLCGTIVTMSSVFIGVQGEG
jgi:hypothetical protein